MPTKNGKQEFSGHQTEAIAILTATREEPKAGREAKRISGQTPECVASTRIPSRSRTISTFATTVTSQGDTRLASTIKWYPLTVQFVIFFEHRVGEEAQDD